MPQRHISRDGLLALCDAVAPEVDWAFIHIPRTGGTAFRAVYGSGPARKPSRSQHPSDGLDAAYLFAFVRNPFDRAVSLCAYLHPAESLKLDTFRHWVLAGCVSPEYKPLTISSPQARWLDDRVVRVQYESREFELPAVLEAIDELPTPIPWLNTSKRTRDWREYYDDETRDAVVERYAEDFEMNLWSTSII